MGALRSSESQAQITPDMRFADRIQDISGSGFVACVGVFLPVDIARFFPSCRVGGLNVVRSVDGATLSATTNQSDRDVANGHMQDPQFPRTRLCTPRVGIRWRWSSYAARVDDADLVLFYGWKGRISENRQSCGHLVRGMAVLASAHSSLSSRRARHDRPEFDLKPG